ncbi:MAG: hypothetical protein QOE93_1299 [Actinomycetota bacterium]|jgi:hypothetical protein|nr:hypothetical protein [Actinomycetota bacterium]
MAAAVTYALPGGRVAVDCRVPGFAGWLDEVVGPGFVRDDPRPTDLSVVVVDRSGDERGEAMGPVPCFALDTGVVHHAGWRVGETIEVVDTNFGARYAVGRDGVAVHPCGPWPRTRVAVLRVIREVATVQALADGSRVQLHAAAVEVDVEGGGRVAVVAGIKEAGKTTWLAHVAASTGAAVVANDRLLASPPGSASAGAAWDVRSVPTIVSVRPGTMECLPHLFRSVPAVPSAAHLTMAEAAAAADREGAVTVPTRLKLSLPQLAAALDAPLSGGGPVATVAVLAPAAGCVGFAVRPLAPDEAQRLLAPVVYGAGSRAGVAGRPTVFEGLVATRRPPDADAAAIRRLAHEVRCVELRVGPGFLASREAAADLLTELTRDR